VIAFWFSDVCDPFHLFATERETALAEGVAAGDPDLYLFDRSPWPCPFDDPSIVL
jgi:hypothetical protein